jgi:hypothetical protein
MASQYAGVAIRARRTMWCRCAKSLRCKSGESRISRCEPKNVLFRTFFKKRAAGAILPPFFLSHASGRRHLVAMLGPFAHFLRFAG